MKYLQGALFLIAASAISVCNDAIMKFTQASVIDTLFWRFFFATLVLLPFFIKARFITKEQKITANSIWIHLVRALIFGGSMFLFLISLKNLPLALTTAINFSIPIWVILLARVFLKESIKDRLLAVSISLFGIILVCMPIWQAAKISYALLLILGAIGFASLDVFNKYLLNKDESMLMMLFGSSFGIMLLCLPFFSFTMPAHLWLFALLGVGANLLLFFILQAWKSCDISAIQPIKYIEFPVSLYLGSVLFKDTANFWLFLGVAFLIFGIILSIKKEISKNL